MIGAETVIEAAIGGRRPVPPLRERFEHAGECAIGPREIRAAIKHSLTMQEAAAIWGLSPTHVSRTVSALGMCWPNMRRLWRSRWIWVDGQYLTLATAAKRAGLRKNNLYRRHKMGIRGPALFGPATWDTRAPAYYEIGWSWSEWCQAVALADEIGDDAARQRLGIPKGAISAARRGEVERLG